MAATVASVCLVPLTFVLILFELTQIFNISSILNRLRPTKIPLNSVRPVEYAEVVLKDEVDIDPNDQNSILEHLDKVVRHLIDKSYQKAVNKSELKLPLVRLKVFLLHLERQNYDYSGFMTINPQRFGQKYVGKVANPQDILIFSKASNKGHNVECQC
ncbi:hypothetical protein POM88_001325 [Heracleum sosnowskyi]|uniref:Mre11 DNA-binding domain-containing protein n=1 Tax=Heracleum sosnowskyi TaxID=360622 RepID=A0AAD8JBX2_9APIA|nr:hypothetical protein POM88_001325 [Heracleum sosnowskyi]